LLLIGFPDAALFACRRWPLGKRIAVNPSFSQ